jgi:CRP-like cAMP-binding protein
MVAIQQNQIRNGLLSRFPPDVFERLVLNLELVDLPRRFRFTQPNEIPEFCYFPETGLGSIVAPSPEGQAAEIGIFGRDGMTPVAVILRSGSDPYSTFMQVGGNGYRIPSNDLMAAMDGNAAVNTLLGRYAQAHAVQTAYTALSNSVHQIDERLARWILMSHDRTDGDEIPLTHDFLSVMLAVRRPSVTTSLRVLEGNRFIRSERGLVRVRNRAALEAFAHDAYGVPEREYERLIGPLSKGTSHAL